MGCLALLILAFVFRGAIFAILGALLSLALSLGFWSLVLILFLFVAAAALG